jgi:hypothetical protein
MRKLPLSILMLAAAPLFAQFPLNTVTITASRTVTAQPDQVVFGLTVSSFPTSTLEQVVAALSPVGITAASLSGVDNSTATTLQWNFNLPVPISNLTATIASLANLAQTIAQNNSGLTLTFVINGVQASAQLQQTQEAQSCTNANLISDATAQGRRLVTAAGMSLGPIVKLSNAPAPEIAVYGNFAVAQLGYVVPNNYTSPLTCSLTVQFQLLP